MPAHSCVLPVPPVPLGLKLPVLPPALPLPLPFSPYPFVAAHPANTAASVIPNTCLRIMVFHSLAINLGPQAHQAQIAPPSHRRQLLHSVVVTEQQRAHGTW